MRIFKIIIMLIIIFRANLPADTIAEVKSDTSKQSKLLVIPIAFYTPETRFGGGMGGESIMRGYYQGRFSDRALLAAQAEYRLPLWWNFGGNVFVSVGEVAKAADKFEINNFKYSFGGGLRYFMDKNERMVIRLDLGFNEEGSNLYIGINEAF